MQVVIQTKVTINLYQERAKAERVSIDIKTLNTDSQL